MRKTLVVTAAGLALCPVAIVGLLLVVLTTTGGSRQAQAMQACTGQAGGTDSGGLGRSWSTHRSGDDLTTAQRTVAATIVAVGQQMRVPPQGIVIALATASQESTFRNLANDGHGDDLSPNQRGVARSLQLPHDGVGSDHGSVGVFQQQYPWWGALEQLMTPAIAARKFYAALLNVPAWLTLPVTVAAQRVQRSAFPNAYADDEPLARQLLTQLSGAGEAAATGMCGNGVALDCPATGLEVEHGLTPDALRVLRCVHQRFGAHAYAGVGQRSNNPDSDHPSGRAVDVMIDDWATPGGNAAGWQIARWVIGNAAGLGVKYVIFNDRIWSVERAASGWRPYGHPSGSQNPTLRHLDHVHVSVFGAAAGDSTNVSRAGWTLPLAAGRYRLTSGYGPRRSPTGTGNNFHTGLDFAAPARTPIRAAASGLVSFTGTMKGYGNLVIVRTGGVETYYAHQITGGIRVRTGQPVQAGQVLGAVGSTGNSTGNHLHFEVRVRGASTDPVPFLRQYGVNPGDVQ
jgi:hypothetical protein